MPRSHKRARPKQKQSAAVIGALIALVMVIVVGGCLCWAIYQGISTTASLFQEDSVEEDGTAILRVAYSPEKEEMFVRLVEDYNRADHQTAAGRAIRVDPIRMEPDAMLLGAISGEFEAMSPDSSIWLHQLDQLYAEQVSDPDAFLVSQTRHYAISPIVIAMWKDAALELGWPDRALGWNSLVNHALANPDFTWSHPSTASASGLLATLAEFYAASGVTRGLTPEDLQKPETIARSELSLVDVNDGPPGPTRERALALSWEVDR